MQKLIKDNKKFSLLVAIIVGIVFISAFSGSPKLAQAPVDNLTAASVQGTLAGQTSTGQVSIAPVSFKFFPSVSTTARAGTLLLFPNYSISIKNGDNIVTEFKVNIQTKVVTPSYASVSWSGVNSEVVTVSINDTKILGLFNINTKYSAYISAINDSTKELSTPLIKELVLSAVKINSESTVGVNTTTNVSADQTFFGRIREGFIEIRTAIINFFSSLFGGSSVRVKTGSSGAGI